MYSKRQFRDLGFGLALLLSLLLILPFAVQAQDGPMTCVEQYRSTDDGIHGELDGLRPASNEGDANWTVSVQTFESRYPDGFTFKLRAESDGGAITNARVRWQHAPGTSLRSSAIATLDPESGYWAATWDNEPSGGDNLPPWLLVRYYWELTDEAGNRYITAEADAVYEDVLRIDDWNHVESEDIVIYWLGLSDDIGPLVLEAMAARREFYCQAWGGLLPYRPRVILFDWSELEAYEIVIGHEARSETAVGSAIQAGQTTQEWGATIQLMLSFESNANLAYGTVLHEIAHLYQEQYANLINDWFFEGNAQYFMVSRDRDYRTYAYQRLQSNDPLSFAAGFPSIGENLFDAYWIGETVWEYFFEVYGIDAHRDLWETMRQGNSRFDAIEIVTGVSIEQFEMDWRAWLGIMTPPPTPIPTPTPLIDVFSMPTPTYPSQPGS